MQTIRPGQAAAVKAPRPAEAILRDRFAWLVTERYDQLGVLATVALGKRKADTVLPALRSTGAGRRTAAPDGSETERETESETAVSEEA